MKRLRSLARRLVGIAKPLMLTLAVAGLIAAVKGYSSIRAAEDYTDQGVYTFTAYRVWSTAEEEIQVHPGRHQQDHRQGVHTGEAPGGTAGAVHQRGEQVHHGGAPIHPPKLCPVPPGPAYGGVRGVGGVPDPVRGMCHLAKAGRGGAAADG